MKKTTTRIGASVAAVALVTGATLATAAPASAATTVGNATFYGMDDFGTESGGYPANDWFYGAIGGGFSPAVAGFTAGGISVETGSTEKFQILTNLAAASPVDAAAFESHVESMYVNSSDTGWYFQLPVYGDGVGEFTTLRVSTPGVNPDLAASWTTSGVIYNDDGTVAYNAGDSATLTQFAVALYGTTTPPQIIAAGAFVDADTATTTIAGFWISGQYSAFSPVVTRTITPNPVTPAETTTSGIRFQGTGWLPGTEVYIWIGACEAEVETPPIYFDTTAVAAADGTVDVTVVLETAPALGTYCVLFDDDGVFYAADAMPELELTVANVLPATGLEVTAPVVGGIAFLVIGGLALAVTRKVERTRA